MGESALRGWGAQVGISVNKSTDQDTTGWDYLLEWPQRTKFRSGEISFPLDRRPAPLQCLLQVKSTEKRQRASVKLSVWDRLVQTPLPCFFLVLEFDWKTEPQRAYLVHLDKEWIRRVLQRLREISAKGGAVELNRKTLDLRWNQRDQLSSPDGQALRQAVQNHVGGSMADYVSRKRKLVESVGYEDTYKRLNITSRPPTDWRGDPEDVLVDWALGLLPYIAFDTAELFDLRFGIPAPQPDEVSGAGSIELANQQSEGESRVLLHAEGINEEIELIANTYSPRGVVGVVAPDRLKVRLAAPFVDVIVYETGSRRVHLTVNPPNPHDEHSLERIGPAAGVLLLIQDAYEQGVDVQFRLTFDGKSIGKGFVSPTMPPPQPFLQWARLAHFAADVARNAGIAMTSMVRVADLAPSLSKLWLASILLKPTLPRLKLTWWQPEILDEAQLVSIPFATTVRIGAYFVQVGGAVLGKPQLTGASDATRRQYLLETSDLQGRQVTVHEQSTGPDRTDQELLNELVAQYTGTTQVVIMDGSIPH